MNIAKLEKSLEKSSKALLSYQNQDGSWNEIPGKKFPIKNHQYFKPIILTSEALSSLVFALKPEYINAIQKAINFCLNFKVEENDMIDFLSWKFNALNYSDSKVVKKQQEKILKKILLRRKNGFWASFPEPNILSNYSIINAVCDEKINFTKTKKWIYNNRGKDGGWGYKPKAQKSFPGFTAEALISLLRIGDSPNSKAIQEFRKYLEKTQAKDGGWPHFTRKYSSISSTSIVAFSLMLVSENPFNKRVEDAVKFILKSQLKDGFFEDRYIYFSYYAHLLFSFYVYLKKKFSEPQTEILRQSIKDSKELTYYFFRKFNDYLKENLEKVYMKASLNSKALGLTSKAIERRKKIIKILNDDGEKTVAEIMDSLKKYQKYKHLNKKSHFTQIKSDVEFLRHMNLISMSRIKYYSYIEFF